MNKSAKSGLALNHISFGEGSKEELKELHKFNAALGKGKDFDMPLPPLSIFRTQKHQFFVARDNATGKIAGFVRLEIGGGGVVTIKTIALRPEYAGFLGKSLLLKAEEFGMQKVKGRGRKFRQFIVCPSFHDLRSKANRQDFISNELKHRRSAQEVRARWFRKQGYFLPALGSQLLVKKNRK